MTLIGLSRTFISCIPINAVNIIRYACVYVCDCVRKGERRGGDPMYRKATFLSTWQIYINSSLDKFVCKRDGGGDSNTHSTCTYDVLESVAVRQSTKFKASIISFIYIILWSNPPLLLQWDSASIFNPRQHFLLNCELWGTLLCIYMCVCVHVSVCVCVDKRGKGWP